MLSHMPHTPECQSIVHTPKRIQVSPERKAIRPSRPASKNRDQRHERKAKRTGLMGLRVAKHYNTETDEDEREKSQYWPVRGAHRSESTPTRERRRFRSPTAAR